MKLICKEVSFKTPIAKLQSKQFAASGVEGWVGWTLYGDTVAREIIAIPPGGQRVRVPFENVNYWIAGTAAARITTEENLAVSIEQDR